MDSIWASLWALFGRFDVWLIAIGGVLLLRQLFTALAADHGRRHDLVKRIYRPSQDFQISILISCLQTAQLTELLELLQAIQDQEYPSAKVAIHIVTSKQTHHDLEGLQMQEVLAPNVRLWHYPESYAMPEKSTSWLIDRCLAVGGAGMFVFLKPSDMIKPDFLQNIVARGFDSFVIQGYIANKVFPIKPVEKVAALTRRLVNRIANAGRYHLGLSCRLQDSGWAIKQDVLELVPFHRGQDVDNLEYTLRLNLENFRVSWAPGVVVYSRDEQAFSDWVSLGVGVVANRLRMFMAYGPRLLTRAVARFDLTYAESALSIIKLPTVVIGAFLFLMGVISSFAPAESWPFGSPIAWFALALSLAVVQFCNVAVARGRVADYVTLAALTPAVYFSGLAMFPVGIVQYWSTLVAQQQISSEERQRSYRRRNSTRFDESQEPVHHQVEHDYGSHMAPGLFSGTIQDPYAPSSRMIQELLHEQAEAAVTSGEVPLHHQDRIFPERERQAEAPNALDTIFSNSKKQIGSLPPREEVSSKPDFWSGVKQTLPFQKKDYADVVGLNGLSSREAGSSFEGAVAQEPQGSMLLPMEQIKAITVSNGQKQLDCLLKTLTTYDAIGDEYYKLTLEYKSLSFSTSTYKILDQAFYELYAKLSGKGLTVMSCGSCGYFYNPTADVPGTLRNSGVCLFGKLGKDVNMSMDAVTVLSPPCDYHRNLEEREVLVQQWKDSLGKQKLASNW